MLTVFIMGLRRSWSDRQERVARLINFFFKQKTAYEMRISDWSSDVCSSDLLVSVSEPFTFQLPQRWLTGVHRLVSHAKSNLGVDGRKIGRASCRERVCQYV